MFGIGSRTFYAMWNGMYFNFEYRRDRDYFVAHAEGAEKLAAADYYKIKGSSLHCIKVYASCCIGSKHDRHKRVEEWFHANK